jgi:3-vinyl bacteriochlorophyllide hydratase
LAAGDISQKSLMYLALAAYASYFINAGQFIYKLRIARLQMQDGVAA